MQKDRVPAAQYLRMSTEHQKYSFENQSAAIQRYAETHGFEIVKTYSDAAKSGLVLKRRHGLRQLIQDVASGDAPHRAILVYDVSRWGRFQDIDESAHYEFLCKSAGVPVHYCAESFANDGSLPSLIMKSLKRTMAGEFSRELGVKIIDGQKRLARLGFKQGGKPGYGLRRLLISEHRLPKQLLADGERKSIATDRVILVPGPANEVAVVREIYRMLTVNGMTVHGISAELNRRGVPHIAGSRWDYNAVYSVLTRPKYCGCLTFGQTSSRLYTPLIKQPKSNWVLAPRAFQPIVSPTTFLAAQHLLSSRTFNKADEEILNSLRILLKREGRLSLELVKNSPLVPSPSTYRLRFGSLRRAYERIGYCQPEQFGPIDIRRRTQALRGELVARIAAMFPNNLSIFRRGGRWRSQLQFSDGLMVSVLIGRSFHYKNGPIRWYILPAKHECSNVTLLARLDEENLSFFDFHIMPNIDRTGRFEIRQNDIWLERGLVLKDLSQFLVSLSAWTR